MARILAIESSGALCSVALDNHGDISSCEQAGERSHTQFLLPFIDGLLQQAGCTVADLDAIAFSAGPGSFTGVRLATSIAKSLGHAAGVPVIPVSSLAIIAQGALRLARLSSPCLVVTDARMGELYVGEYTVDADLGVVVPLRAEALVRVESLSWQDYAATVIAGDALPLLEGLPGFDRLQQIGMKPHAGDLLSLAAQALLAGKVETGLSAQAVYLRGKSGWKTVEQQRLGKKPGHAAR